MSWNRHSIGDCAMRPELTGVGNLVATQASKKQLGTVSSKGRGTTCLTLGVIILALIIFVWTYMLIRFT